MAIDSELEEIKARMADLEIKQQTSSRTRSFILAIIMVIVVIVVLFTAGIYVLNFDLFGG
ncbi:hypothetical protein [Paenibacillus sp. R14(2021)]|uniref:hypothetical protein n=1 Tax=Paenibacillus sp. R14(2021) TaxID=2859228 RepID=UPI001C615FA4|nr:hypothetical protein [Paenibacillus sp. R14(2021)]